MVALDGNGQGKTSLFPFIDGERWGYIDVNGKTIIEPQYILMQNFITFINKV